MTFDSVIPNGLILEFEPGAFGDAATFIAGVGVFGHSGSVIGLGDLASREFGGFA